MPTTVRESRELQRRIDHVRRFREAFREALALADEQWQDELGTITRRPSDANQERYDAALDRLGELAGVALAAAGDVQSGVTRYGKSYNPLMQWRDPFQAQGGLASAQEVIDSCYTVTGSSRVALSRRRQSRQRSPTESADLRPSLNVREKRLRGRAARLPKPRSWERSRWKSSVASLYWRSR